MDKQKLQTLKGFRDIMPQQKRQRNFIINKIIKAFELFAFEPLETPTLEYAELLLDKYGTEADKLIYTFTDRGGRKLGLRYDQTVPTARILAQYRNNLPKFFRRYQIQNVFRAENPQQGRFREFMQCDMDIFGTTSQLADAEILACTYQAFINIGFDQVQLLINDRQLLVEKLKAVATEQADVFSLIQSLDKLDKFSQEEVRAELTEKGLTAATAQDVIKTVSQLKINQNLETIKEQAIKLGVKAENLIYSPTLARGLDYYTGMIVEVNLPAYQSGSCGGGGRYDNLIKELSGVAIPAVGFSFGVDRIVAAASEANLFPDFAAGSQVLITLFNENTVSNSLKAANQLRQAGIAVEIYPELDKLGKQFKMADQKQIPFTIVIGEDEQKNNQATLKNMKTGKQKQLSLSEVIQLLKEKRN